MIKRIKIQEKRTMTREEFITLSKDHILYLDGATGSNLVKAGMPSGVCPEQWILEHQDVMLQLQKDYVQAGTNILYAPTFTANRVKLAEYHLEKNMTSMIRDLVAISKKAAESTPGHPVYVAGDLTMTGEQLKPMGKMELETLIDIYKEQILCLVDAGADLLVVETMMSLAETRAALIAAKEVCDLPVIATLTFEADGRTLFGTDAKTAAIVLESLGASAIGANCSTGPAQMESIISEMVSHTRIPVIAKPNAGLPFLDENGTTCYNMEAEEFAEEMEVLVNAGATILGGCCGTTPEFIRQIHERFGTDAKVAASRRPDGIRYLTSERITHSFGLDDGFFVVGERINPTGKKALQAQLREGSFEKVIQFAEEQEACGAKVLDINMGMSGIDEKASMLRALEEVSGVTNLPLSLDSSYVEVLEAALRNYPGRALVNSVSLETEKFEKLLPIVAKYGAMFILLPLSDAGLPKDIEEKKEIIHKIYDRALSLGMCKEDIVVDGLVATVGANPKAALETLETIRYCKENGFATICGLSNISFAMPERSFVNTAFLTLAIQAGLSKYRDGLCQLESFTKEDAREVISIIEGFQQQAMEKFGEHFVHASDEWYITAGYDMPGEDRYDGYIQLENGVGMTRLFLTEAQDAVDIYLEDHDGKPWAGKRKVSTITGLIAYDYVCQVAEIYKQAAPGLDLQVFPIRNDFFGEKITVTGLLTGQDIVKQLQGKDLGEALFLPSQIVKADEPIFLDDMTVEELQNALQVPVIIVQSSGVGLFNRMIEMENEHE